VNIPELGVGLKYIPGIDPILDRYAKALQVLEVGAQTPQEKISARPIQKVLHGAGVPIGGTRPTEAAQNLSMRRMAEALTSPSARGNDDEPWVGVPLGFNRFHSPGGEDQESPFLLPLRQTPEGACAAVRSIRALADALQRPVAVEAQANYLCPRNDEMEDGLFLRAVVETADCGIVLNVTNLWTNQSNGRQTAEAFLEQIPLDRVWHLRIPEGDDLFELSHRIVTRLPNLRALILETHPLTFQPAFFKPVQFHRELQFVQKLWERRGTKVRQPASCPPAPRVIYDPRPTAQQWEDALGRIATGKPPRNDLELSFYEDPGMRILQQRYNSSRSSVLPFMPEGELRRQACAGR
jgi:uncharacterized protein